MTEDVNQAADQSSTLVERFRWQRRHSPERVDCLNAFEEKVCDMFQFLLTVRHLDHYLRLMAGDDTDLDDIEATRALDAIMESVRELGLLKPDVLEATAHELRGFLPLYQQVTGGDCTFDDDVVTGIITGIVRQRLGIYSLRLGESPDDADLLRRLEAQVDRADAQSRGIREILASDSSTTQKIEGILSLS